MKYFLDTEFIEDFHKPLFGKRRHFIDMISIGIVAEDGREYYAISNEFNEKDASQWVKDNVIHPIFKEACNYDSGIVQFERRFIKSNAEIAKDIIEFINHEPVKTIGGAVTVSLTTESEESIRRGYLTPEFYAYYADYDWVLFCSLFGTMMNLPKGFPMYCHDLKQDIDRAAKKMMRGGTPEQIAAFRKECERVGGLFSVVYNNSFEDMLGLVKSHKCYPKETNEHNALADARWNKQLYEYITTWL